MSVLAKLALLFVGIPLLELVILIQLGKVVGLLPTVALVFATGIVGAALARHEGLRTLRAFRGELAAGRIPGTALMDGVSILVGGALLLTPGLLTDVFGFTLILPPTRRILQRRIGARIRKGIEDGSVRFAVYTPGPFQQAPDEWQEPLDRGPPPAGSPGPPPGRLGGHGRGGPGA